MNNLNESQKQAMRDHCATVVMGWVLSPETGSEHASYRNQKNYDPNYASDEQDYEYLVMHYDPFTNLQQAFDLLDKFTHWGIGRVKDGYNCLICTDPKAFGDADAEHGNLLYAICLAVCRATGFEVNDE